MCRLAALLVGAVGGVSTPSVALSVNQEPLQGVTLEYTAPTGCSSQSEVLTKLREALGAAANGLPRIVATIRVVANASTFVVSYRAWKGEIESRRTLVVDSCAAASEASALLLLLTLDPMLAESLGATRVVARAETSEPTPEPESLAPASAEPHAPRAAAPLKLDIPKPLRIATAAPEREKRIWLEGGWLTLGGSFISAISPAPAFGVSLEGGLRTGSLRFGARGGWARSLAASLDEVSGARVEATLLRAHLLAALDFGREKVRFGPEVELGVEYLSAEVTGISVSRPGSTPLLSASAGVWTNVLITGSCGLAARLSVLAPLERPYFRVGGLHETVHRPGAVGADATVGIFWFWGSQS